MTNSEIQDHQRAQIDKLHTALRESYITNTRLAELHAAAISALVNVTSREWLLWIDTDEGMECMAKFNNYSCLQAELNEGTEL